METKDYPTEKITEFWALHYNILEQLERDPKREYQRLKQKINASKSNHLEQCRDAIEFFYSFLVLETMQIA